MHNNVIRKQTTLPHSVINISYQANTHTQTDKRIVLVAKQKIIEMIESIPGSMFTFLIIS